MFTARLQWSSLPRDEQVQPGRPVRATPGPSRAVLAHLPLLPHSHFTRYLSTTNTVLDHGRGCIDHVFHLSGNLNAQE